MAPQTGLFNSFTFYHVGNASIDMQSRLFSVFMTLTISPPLIQQLQPKFLNFRNIYQSREANSKIYSWIALVTGAILPELPYSILAGTLYFVCWWCTFPSSFARFVADGNDSPRIGQRSDIFRLRLHVVDVDAVRNLLCWIRSGNCRLRTQRAPRIHSCSALLFVRSGMDPVLPTSTHRVHTDRF